MIITTYTFTEEIKNIISEQRRNGLCIPMMKMEILKVEKKI